MVMPLPQMFFQPASSPGQHFGGFRTALFEARGDIDESWLHGGYTKQR